jgi:hypothetical protein
MASAFVPTLRRGVNAPDQPQPESTRKLDMSLEARFRRLNLIHFPAYKDLTTEFEGVTPSEALVEACEGLTPEQLDRGFRAAQDLEPHYFPTVPYEWKKLCGWDKSKSKRPPIPTDICQGCDHTVSIHERDGLKDRRLFDAATLEAHPDWLCPRIMERRPVHEQPVLFSSDNTFECRREHKARQYAWWLRTYEPTNDGYSEFCDGGRIFSH